MSFMAATPKILVVDDEPDLEPLMLQRMRRDIRKRRYQFVFAHNGLEALEVLEQDSTIDMVLSDINMPRMDGLALLSQIAKVAPNLRSVIISAYGDMKNIRTAMNRGAFDFVTKPIDFDDLRVTIDRTLRHLAEWREAIASRDKLITLQNELDVATKIQQSILPTQFPRGDEYEVFGHMEAARNVGGDFFDVLRLEYDRIGLAIADVSDKGVPAALFMMSTRTLLKGTAIGGNEPGDVLGEVNDQLCEDNDAEMFVTVLYAVYDPQTKELTYSNGGHDSPLIIHADGSSTLLPLTRGIALGVMPGLTYHQQSVKLEPGDTVVLYTDGVTEAMNAEGEQYGLDDLRDMFSGAPPGSSEDANKAVFDAVHRFAQDTPQSDDITCLVMRRGGNGN
ncbi:MAG: SpoIIE family protein phosphatase [Proteobacteria bacterium]|nr:SpoIIE family protein phosphatase [Pseudomonadota bacterium]MYJ96045.1 SpoIIE family protein phosphatase [Pseudomonadota bacterium]